jgi:hypothetical protein
VPVAGYEQAAGDHAGSSCVADRRDLYAVDRREIACKEADQTFVLPATGFGNVVIALLSRFWLHEAISPARWAGIVLITVGVGFVAQGPSLTERPEDGVNAPAETEQPAPEEQVR